MTKEQINIAIAELCGWTNMDLDSPDDPEEIAPFGKHPDGYYDKSPNYAADLNAMHEAEKALTYEEHCAYCDTLSVVRGGPAYQNAVRSTATERAEAFLRVKGKWVEGAAAAS